VAEKPGGPYKPKGKVYTYEDWSPYAGKNPLYVQELTQNERVNLLRQTTSPEEFPQRLARISSMYPDMNLGSMVGLAGVNANDDALAAAARIDTMINANPTNVSSTAGTSMVQAGSAGYDYLNALGKTEENASEKDKQDASWFAGLKTSTRYLTTGLYTSWQLLTNTARQLDAAYNVWNDKDKADKGPVQAGELALDFTQIVKDTYLYQNLVKGKSLGEGYFPGGDAVLETERIAAQIATVNGKAYTPGRALEATMGIDPGERGYGVVSGIIDGVMALKLDPTIIAGRLKVAKEKEAAQAAVREGVELTGRIRTGLKDVELQAKQEIRELARVRAKDAAKNLGLTKKELLEEQTRIINEIRTIDEGFANGKLANGAERIQAARKRAGLEGLYAQRDKLIAQADAIKPSTQVQEFIPTTREESFAAVKKQHPNMIENPTIGMVKTNFVKKFMEYDRSGAQGKFGNDDYSKKTIALIMEDLRSGKGLENPLVLEYNPYNHTFVLGEGNHRLAAAIEAGIEEVPVAIIRTGSGTLNHKPAGFGQRMFPENTSTGKPEKGAKGYFPGNPSPIELLPEEALGKATKETKVAGELIRDSKTNKLLSAGQSAKFVREQIAKVDEKINTALEDIYLQNNPAIVQMLTRGRDELLEKSLEYGKQLKEFKDPAEIKKLTEARRAGILESSSGLKTDIEAAKRWIADGNADELFQAVADEVSPTAIMSLMGNKVDAILAGQLAKADNIDDVERILLTQMGIKVTPQIQRGIAARYLTDPVKIALTRIATPITANEKLLKTKKFLFSSMPSGRPVMLQDTIGLVKETRRWMIAARYDEADITKVLDEIILSDSKNYQLRQQIMINMLKSTGNKYKEALDAPNRVKNEIDRALTAYSSELSGMREYASENVGDIFRKEFMVNGELIDLSGKPTSIAQLAHEIVLPDVYKLRELTGSLAKLTRWVDNKVAKDSSFMEINGFRVARFARSTSDGFLRQILLAYRGAYIARNILEMQTRSFLAGGMNVFTNPVATISMVMSNKKIGNAVTEMAQKSDPFLVDVNGKRFLDQNINDYFGQSIYNSFIHVMTERGFANDGRAIRGAIRSGDFGLMRFTGTNVDEYAEALAYRMMMHYADPMKRAIIGKKLPGKYQNLVATNKMTFEDAFIRAVRDGAFKNEIDILGKSVPEIRRLLSTDEGMRVFFFKGQNSYANEVIGETLGNVEWKNFVGTGKVTLPVKKNVLDPQTNKMVQITEDKVVFELGADAQKNVKALKKIIATNLVDRDSIEFANAMQLSIPAVLGKDIAFGYKKFMDNFFRMAARVETRTVYGPEYRIAYWNAVSDLAPMMSKGAAQKLLDGATDIKKTKVAVDQPDGTVIFEEWIKRNPAFADIENAAKNGDGFLSAREIDEYARDKAAKHLSGLFYDATQKKNIAYAAQLVIPFANAWANTIKKWSELSSSPARLGARITPSVRLFNTLQSEESAAIYDVMGTRHDPSQGFIHENAYGDKVFTIPLTGYLRTVFGAFGDPQAADVTVPINSLNLVAAGASIPGSEIGITPGIGTHINMAYSYLPESWKNSVPPVVANIIAPYGDKSGNPLAPLPAWLQKVVSGFVGTEEARLKFAKPLMAWEASSNPKYKPLFDGTPLTIEERSELQTELATTAMEQSRWQYFMQGVLQNVSPGTPVFEYYAKNDNGDTFFQWQMAQALNQLFDVYDGNYEMAIAEYGIMFGRQAIMASMSASEGTVFADDRAWQFASANPNAFKAYADVIPYFFVGSDFSTEYKRAMERRGYGKKLSTKELLAEADRLSLAAVKGQLAIEAARNGYGLGWIDQKVKQYGMEVLQGYEPEVTINTNSRAQRILKVESALQRPEFAQTQAGIGASKYAMERKKALEIASARYPDRKNPSLDGVDNADLRAKLETLGQQLSQGNPDFANLYQRVYLSELRAD
jgi:hypothetical protein